MTHYKEIGLSNTKEMFRKAMDGGYAIPAYNFNNLEQLQAIVTGCLESRSPLILQISKGARKYANQTLLRYMAEGAMDIVNSSEHPIPVALHLDHGDTYELAVSCIETGFSSVMIDGSAHAYDDNVALTAKVVEYAHKHDVSVEGELGVLAGIEDAVSHEVSNYTDPDDVEDFVKKPASTALPYRSGPPTAPTSSRSNPANHLPPFASTSSRRSKSASPGFPSCCTGHPRSSRRTWT